jgi:hypothetical protein
MKRWIAVAAIGAASLALWGTAQVASAAKPEQEAISLDCGADGTFQVTTPPGNGQWTPARIVGGGTIIPVAFSKQHGTFTDNSGQVFTEDPPDVSKGGPPNKDFINCHFVVTFEDKDGSGTFQGDVMAFIVGR